MNKLKLQKDAELKVIPIRLLTNMKFECFRISSDFWFAKYDDRDTSTYYYSIWKTEKYVISLKYNTSDNITFKWNLRYEKINEIKTFNESFRTELEVAIFINTELK